MRILIAGGTGALGSALTRVLTAKGHEVGATSRNPAKIDALSTAGVSSLQMDGLDRDSVFRAIEKFKPEVLVHQMTSLSGMKDLKNFDREFTLTNRLRTEGLDNLIAAAKATGVKQIVVQSFTGWPNVKAGSALKIETDALDSNPPVAMRETLHAIKYIETSLSNLTGVRGAVLRYGAFYGPNTSISMDGDIAQSIRKRMLPLVGSAKGVWSFIHIQDAAEATALAIEQNAEGVFNIVDDDPAPVSDWLPHLAERLNAKPPFHVPVWLASLLIGDAGVSLMTQIRGSSNQRAKSVLGWRPRFSSWREGFCSGLD